MGPTGFNRKAPDGVTSNATRDPPSHKAAARQAWPKNRAAFWRKKILGNKARDRRVNRLLRRAGWQVLRIWEHDLANKHRARLVKKLHARGLVGL